MNLSVIPATSRVTIGNGGALDLAGFNCTIGSLAGQSLNSIAGVFLGSATLILGQEDA